MLGKRLAAERRRLGLTQEKLAETIGLQRAAVAMVESGKSGLDAERLAQLSLNLGIDAHYVMFGEPLARAGVRALDPILLMSILNGIARWRKRNTVEISAEKHARLLKHLYEHFCQLESVEEGRIDEALAAAA